MLRKAMPAVVLCAFLFPAGLVHAGDLTVDEILARNIEARGGMDGIKGVKSAVFTGTMSMMDMEVPLTVEFLRPMQVRIEFVIQGVTGIRAYDGETGWEVMPFMGKTEPSLVSQDDLKDLQDQADFDGPFVDYAEKGHTVELVGKVDADGTEAYQVKLVKKNGDEELHYFDTEHFLEFKVEGKRMMQGTESRFSTIIGDYKEVEGVLIPHSIENSFGESFSQTITISDVEFNAEIGPDRFKMPEPRKDEAASGD